VDDETSNKYHRQNLTVLIALARYEYAKAQLEYDLGQIGRDLRHGELQKNEEKLLAAADQLDRLVKLLKQYNG